MAAAQRTHEQDGQHDAVDRLRDDQDAHHGDTRQECDHRATDDQDGEDVKWGAREPIPYLLGVIAERHSGRLTSLKQIVIKCPRNFSKLLAIFTPLSARATR